MGRDCASLAGVARRREGALRERADGAQRISLRTGDGVDASGICARLGGGGHTAAAGCTITTDREKAKEIILAEIQKELELLQE